MMTERVVAAIDQRRGGEDDRGMFADSDAPLMVVPLVNTYFAMLVALAAWSTLE